MSRAKLAAVIATVGLGDAGAKASIHDHERRTVWLFEIDENYSLDAVRAFFAKNRHAFGDTMHVRCEMARFKSAKRLIAWADRKGRNSAGMPPLTGWTGPLSLARSV